MTLLRCTNPDCRTTYPPSTPVYTCNDCGELLEVSYDWTGVAAESLKALFRSRREARAGADGSGVFRFRELLPFCSDPDAIVSLREGNTPLLDAPRSARYAGLAALGLKHLGFNPTGSFKDYGMSAGMTHARSLNARWVACASTGNTSASMAAYSARAGIPSLVFVPEGKIALGKLAQALDYGARTLLVEGNFDESMRLVYQVAREKGIYLLNSINPFRIEGQKAIVFEILEHFDWEPPDWIVLPGGNLGNCAAFGKALAELQDLGFIQRLPRLAVIQAANAGPFYRAWRRRTRNRLEPVRPSTLASAINIGNPVSWKKAMRALALTDGVCEQVTENEIANAKAVVGRDGIGCEPASAASLAGIKKLTSRGVIDREARVVGVLTGHLLKDTDYTLLYHSDPEARGSTAGSRDFAAAGIRPRFGNYPICVAAEKSTIIKILDELYGD